MNRASLIGTIAGIAAGVAVTFLGPALAPISKFFLWPSAPAVMAILAIQGGGTVTVPSYPVLIANAVIYGLAGFLVGLMGGLIRRMWSGIRRTWSPPVGHCRKCGYDLTGNISGVCPECGAKVERA